MLLKTVPGSLIFRIVEWPNHIPETTNASRLKKLVHSWVINTLAVLVAVYLIPGIHFQGALDVCVASLLLGILNAILRPVLMLMALPLVILTLGLFTLVINALLLCLVSYLLRPHFSVDSFWSAFWGALLISLVSTILNLITGGSNARIRIARRSKPPPPNHTGNGPVIDV